MWILGVVDYHGSRLIAFERIYRGEAQPCPHSSWPPTSHRTNGHSSTGSAVAEALHSCADMREGNPGPAVGLPVGVVIFGTAGRLLVCVILSAVWPASSKA
jgi:hypothetical protein